MVSAARGPAAWPTARAADSAGRAADDLPSDLKSALDETLAKSTKHAELRPPFGDVRGCSGPTLAMSTHKEHKDSSTCSPS